MTTEQGIREGRIEAADDLRAITGFPADGARRKDIGRLDRHATNFIANSPFCLVATSGAGGRCDVSPRGDPPGFVRVVDEHTLAIPERPGNRRADTLMNIVENPHIGLFFMIPGIEDTLRVNGRASVVKEQALLESMAHQGKVPALAIVVEVEECFLHCAKAFRRSRLWEADARRDRSEFPSAGEIFRDMLGLQDQCTIEELDASLEEANQKTMY